MITVEHVMQQIVRQIVYWEIAHLSTSPSSQLGAELGTTPICQE